MGKGIGGLGYPHASVVVCSVEQVGSTRTANADDRLNAQERSFVARCGFRGLRGIALDSVFHLYCRAP